MTSASHLYHHTSVATLALILQSRRFKFNRLDRVNDPLEGQSVDRASLGMYVFASCWTANENANPVLWKEYGDAERGVRIRMPVRMFKTYALINDPTSGFIVQPGARWLVTRNEIHGHNFLVAVTPKDFLVQMQYTEDPAQYKPQVSPNPNLIQFGKIGICKRAKWSPEEEWRFRFWVVPAPAPPKGSYADPAYKATWLQETLASFNRRHVEQDAFYLSLADEAFAEMQIHLGQKQSADERKATRELVVKYNPDATIVE